MTEADLKCKWSVVFFYPADFTFVCPTELEDLADNYAAFQKLGVEIYSVSTDTHFAHKAWHDTSDAVKKINYTMIGDPTHVLSRNFDVLIEADGIADRGTFVIDPSGKIQIIELNAGGIGRDASELLVGELRRLRNDVPDAVGEFVCPEGAARLNQLGVVGWPEAGERSDSRLL